MGPDHSMMWRFLAICLGVLALLQANLALRNGSAKNWLFAAAWLALAIAYAVKGHYKKREEDQMNTDETTANNREDKPK